MRQLQTPSYLYKSVLVFAAATVLFACKKSNTQPAPQPPVISYNQKIVSVEVGQAIPTLVPDSSKGGHIEQYSVYPGLPKGITLNQSNGTISGTPTDSLNPTRFVITAFGPAGMGHDTITISVGTIGFVYGTTGNYTFTINSNALATTPLAPTVLAGNFKQFFINPNLSPNDLTSKTGLAFDMATGKISGTPGKITNTSNTEVPTPLMFVITGITQDNKAAYDTIYITVNDVAPNVVYPFKGSFAVGDPMGTSLEPYSVLGAVTPSSVKKYELAPGSNPLPAGVHLDPLYGYIGQVVGSTGTVIDVPAAPANTTVTVRAMNTGGYQDIVVPIVIKSVADAPAVKYMMSIYNGDIVDTLCPSIFSGGVFYLTKQDAINGVPTIYMNPVVTDGQVKSSSAYSILAPTLPSMSVSSSTGVYSGVPSTSTILPLAYTGRIQILNAQTTAPADTFDLSNVVVNAPFFNYNSGGTGGTTLANVYEFIQDSAVNNFTSSKINSGTAPVYTAAQLVAQPQNGAVVASYAIYPASTTTASFASTGLTFNTTTGAISGTPTTTTALFTNYPAWNYVIVGTKADGSFTLYKIAIKIYDVAANYGNP